MQLLKFIYASTISFLEKRSLKKLSVNPKNKYARKLLHFFNRQYVTESIAHEGDVLVDHLEGCLFICDRNDLIQMELIKRRTFAGHIIAAVQSLVRPGTIFIDVGAHCGAISIPIAASNPKSRVIAVEPQSGLVDRLTKNQKLNHLKNLEIESIGLASQHGDLEISLPIRKDGTVISELVGKLDDEYSGRRIIETIQVSTLDSLMMNQDSSVSVIKIDVQGNELEVLRGANETLSNCRPALIIEIEDKLSNDASAHRTELKKILKEHNYEIFLLDEALPGRFLLADLDLPMENDFIALPC